MSLWFWATFLFCLVAIVAPPASAQSLEQAAAIALAEHPKVSPLREAVRAAEAEVEIPETNRNLRVSLEGGLGQQRTRDSGPSSVISPTLRLRKLLHDAGRTDGEVRLREARLDGARSTLTAGQEDLALEVATAYVQVARASDSLDAGRQWLAGLGGIASMTRDIQQIDRGRQFDNALAGSRVQRAEAELLTRQTALADALAQLRGVVGRKVEPVLPLVDRVSGSMAGVEVNLDEHPQMRISRATLEVAKEQAALDRLYDRPQVSVEAFAGSGHNIYGRFQTLNNVGLQLVGNVSLLDGGAGAATSKASLVRVQQAEQAMGSTLVELLTAQSRLKVLLEGRKARAEGLEQAYRQAVALAAQMREQFRAGRRPLVDLLSQETEIYQTRLGVVGERYDALLAEIRMAHTSGRLLAALNIENTPAAGR